MKIISSRQCRTARAWLGWSQKDLSEQAGPCISMIASLETDARNPHDDGKIALRETFERAGIIFEPDYGLSFPARSFPVACRTARTWLGWTEDELAKRIGVVGDLDKLSPLPTLPLTLPGRMIAYFERESLKLAKQHKEAIERAFTQAGLKFEPSRGLTFKGDGGMSGRKPRRQRHTRGAGDGRPGRALGRTRSAPGTVPASSARAG